MASPSGPSLLLSAGFEMPVFPLYQTAFSLGKFIFILKCISVWFLVSSSLAGAREQRVDSFCSRILLRFSLRSRTRPSVNTSPVLENEACSVYPVSFPRNSSDLRAVGLVSCFPCSWTFSVLDNGGVGSSVSVSLFCGFWARSSYSVSAAFRCHGGLLRGSTGS